jgi:O-antigen ligase
MMETFRVKNIHFFIIMLCVLMQMLNIGWAYRSFAYANLIIVLIDVVYQYKFSKSFKIYEWVKYPLYFLLGFAVLHFIAVQNFIIIKEMRHFLLAIFLTIGVAMFGNQKNDYIRKTIFSYVVLIVLIYVTVQAISLWYFNKPYGTTKNPHYLALYSSVSIIVGIYSFFNVSIKLRWILGVCVLLLGAFLIESASRPAWIALIISGFLFTFFLKGKSKHYAVVTIFLTIIVLSLTNLGGFAARSADLIENVKSEERVAIWQETWKMQSNSSISEWIAGHGINNFEDDFKPYSSYHLKNIDFNSPHNYFLELLYTTGLLGLFLASFMFWVIYQNLMYLIKLENSYKFVFVTLMAIMTLSIIFASITLPFFTSYSMNIIALVIGSMLFLKKVDNS